MTVPGARYPTAIQNLATDAAPDGTRVFWANPSLANPNLLRTQANFSAPVLGAEQTLLKEARQRFVFRQHVAGRSYVFKLFPLSFIGSRLRHPKYAYREFSNMRAVAQLGVPTPEPIAFLEKRRNVLVSCSGLIQEDLSGFTDLMALANRDPASYTTVTKYASDALCLAFEKGANHVDLRDENIMINLQTGDWRIIDWQYASCVAPRAPWLLEYLVAYFIRLAPEKWRSRLLSEWVGEIHARANHATPADVFDARVSTLAAQRSKLKHRLTLRPAC